MLEAMDIISIYAIAAGGIFVSPILLRVVPYLIRLTNAISILIPKHLTYAYLLNRHRHFGPWTPASVLLHFTYVAVNIFCISFQVPSAAGAGRRAGTLSLVNMAFLFMTTYLGFLADVFGVSLHTRRRIHRTTGWMAGALPTVHIVIATIVQQANFSLHKSDNLFALIVRPTVYKSSCELTTNTVEHHW